MSRNFVAEAIELERKLAYQAQGGNVIGLDDVRQAHEVAKATGHMSHKLLYVQLKHAQAQGQRILEERTKQEFLMAAQK